MTNAKGFTLIEVMIAVAIVAILAAVALPSYGEHSRRAKLIEATSQVADLRVRMEQFFLDNRSYQNAAGSCGVAMPSGSAVKYFTFACNTAGPMQYTVTASGAGEMTGLIYTINEQNVRATTGVPPGWAGWVTKADCWVLKKGGVC